MKSELVPMTTTAPVDPGHIFDDNTIVCSQTYCLVQAGFEQSRGDLGVWRCYATKRHVWMNHRCKVKAGCTDVRMVDIEVTASDEIGLEEQWDIAPPHEE